jgi:hypothetical protein
LTGGRYSEVAVSTGLTVFNNPRVAKLNEMYHRD